MIKIKNLNFQINKNKMLLSDINLDIAKNSKCALIGANGAGKSTLINCLLNINEVYSGNIEINDINAKKPKTHAFLSFFPSESLNLHINARSFLINCFLLDINSKEKAYARIEYLTTFFKINPIIFSKNISKLSSGEKQIIKLFYTFLVPKPIIILDEPTNYLDFKMKASFFKLIKTPEFANTTFLISSHEILELKNNTDSVIYLQNGKIEFSGD
jgi:ABC-type multidrug transport system ATPase subunit